MPEQKKNKEIDIKLGSEDMVYWQTLIDAKERDIKISEENLRFYRFIVENAKKEYEKAEKEFNAKPEKSI